LLAHGEGQAVARIPVFSAETTRTLRTYLRAVVTNGTGHAAEAPGGVIGKTGTAEQLGEAGYDEDRNFSSFAGLFPAAEPRYVIVVALDEPRAAQAGGLTTGGAVAAPAVSRMVTRAAPLLGLRAD
jgi:cell division protein FtsI (penicillin-binding protein 3)